MFVETWVRQPCWHMTLDTWHRTSDMWHVTRAMWHVTHGGGLTFSQTFSSLAFTVWDWQCLEDSEKKEERLNEWIIHKGVCRTAPATPSLLNTSVILSVCQYIVYYSVYLKWSNRVYWVSNIRKWKYRVGNFFFFFFNFLYFFDFLGLFWIFRFF